jgi:hypothetical protein
MAKFEIIFPFEFEKVICACIPSYEVEIFDNNVNSFQDLGHFSSDELKKKGYNMKRDRSCSLINYDVEFPFPLKTMRKYPNITSVDYFPETKTFQLIHKVNKTNKI